MTQDEKFSKDMAIMDTRLNTLHPSEGDILVVTYKNNALPQEIDYWKGVFENVSSNRKITVILIREDFDVSILTKRQASELRFKLNKMLGYDLDD